MEKCLIPFSALMYSCVKYPHLRDRLCSDVGANDRSTGSMVSNGGCNHVSAKGSAQLIPVVAARFCFRTLILLAWHSDGIDIIGS